MVGLWAEAGCVSWGAESAASATIPSQSFSNMFSMVAEGPAASTMRFTVLGENPMLTTSCSMEMLLVGG